MTENRIRELYKENKLLPSLVNDYFLNFDKRNHSKKTIETYTKIFNTFFQFVEGKYAHVWLRSEKAKLSKMKYKNDYSYISERMIKNISTNDVNDFVDLFIVKGNKPTTINNKINALNSLFKYLEKKEVMKNVMNGIEIKEVKEDKKVIEYMQLEDVKRFIKTIRESNLIDNKRDLCMFTILFNTGVRADELLGIDLDRTHLEERYIVVLGKGSKQRVVMLSSACINTLKSYLSGREKYIKSKLTVNNALFLSNQGKRMSYANLNKNIKKYARMTGLDEKDIHLHICRHTFATTLYKSGEVDIRALQELMGHESISTTQIYTHVDDEVKKNIVENSPLNF